VGEGLCRRRDVRKKWPLSGKGKGGCLETRGGSVLENIQQGEPRGRRCPTEGGRGTVAIHSSLEKKKGGRVIVPGGGPLLLVNECWEKVFVEETYCLGKRKANYATKEKAGASLNAEVEEDVWKGGVEYCSMSRRVRARSRWASSFIRANLLKRFEG